MNQYHAKIRRAISDNYIECFKTRSMAKKEQERVIERLKFDKNLLHTDYLYLQEKEKRLTKEIEELNIQIDIWDKVLNIADEML